jgi:spermidine synthase
MAAVYARGARGRTRGPRVELHIGPRGRSLRIDGSYASWWKPGRTTTGSVWDALAAPLLLLPPERRRSLLVLGLGGGSAARVLRSLAPSARIVGVERDASVLRAARRGFGLDELGVEVVEADARDYLAGLRRRFDLIVEDVFVGRDRGVRKPDWLGAAVLGRLAGRLAPGGVLVSNALDEAPATARTFVRLFRASLCLAVDDFDNRVFAGCDAPCRAGELRAALAREPLFAAALPRLSLRTLSGRRRGTGARSG